MTLHNIIRAWKDETYRASLSAAERAQLPEHPAGLIELDDAEQSLAAGGIGTRSDYFDCNYTLACSLGDCDSSGSRICY